MNLASLYCPVPEDWLSKDIVILAGAVVLLSDSSQRVLKTLKKS